jgi:2'-5' RNA ligase
VQSCAAGAPDFRWVETGNLHLTVRFVGAVEPELLEGIAGRLEGSAGPSFELGMGDVGTFRRGRLVRVVWLGVSAGADALRALAESVETECRNAGLESEQRAFTPHLTLARARARDGATLPVLPSPPDLPTWRAEELVLFQSHLSRAGAVHEPIRRIRLAAST